MKIAHIVPTHFLGSLTAKHEYYLVLAHLVQDDTSYAEWHEKVGGYKILDNGVEEGEKIPLDVLVDAAKRIKATELVLPDVFEDGDATLASTELALGDPAIKALAETGVKMAAVAHGKDRSSWIHCFDVLNADPRIHTVMIPKVLDKTWGYGGRFAACSYLQATRRITNKKDYHLLGVWTDPLEVYLHSTYNKWIRGLDTALAFQAGYQEVSISYLTREGGHKPKRPQSYFSIDHLSSVQMSLVRENISLLDGWGVSRGKLNI